LGLVLYYRKAEGSSLSSKKVNGGKAAVKKAPAGNNEGLDYVQWYKDSVAHTSRLFLFLFLTFVVL